MIRKYITPPIYEKVFNAKVVYCKIIDSIATDEGKIYLIEQINNGKRTFIFNEKELHSLNIADWFELIRYRRKKNGNKSKSI